MSLHMKLAWNLLPGSFLWVTFFLSKYDGDQHISLVASHKGSKFWKMLLKSVPLVHANSKWQIKDGKVSFWHDCWFGCEPLCNQQHVADLPTLKLEDCKSATGWNVDLFTRLVGHEKIEEIIDQLGRRFINLAIEF